MAKADVVRSDERKAPLTQDEEQDFKRHEETIEKGLATFFEVGNALEAIREGRLYRQTHGDFDSYCRERWNLSRRHADRQIKAAKLGPIGLKLRNESQARKLLTLKSPEQRQEAAAIIEERFVGGFADATADDVEEAAREVRGESPRPKPRSAKRGRGGPVTTEDDLHVLETSARNLCQQMDELELALNPTRARRLVKDLEPLAKFMRQVANRKAKGGKPPPRPHRGQTQMDVTPTGRLKAIESKR